MRRSLLVIGPLLLLPLADAEYGTARAQAVVAESGLVSDAVRRSIIEKIGGREADVELAATPNILTILRVNSGMNASSHAGRNDEAATIAEIVITAMGTDPRFGKILVIRVEYVRRAAAPGFDHLVDIIEFRRSPSGAFDLHVT